MKKFRSLISLLLIFSLLFLGSCNKGNGGGGSGGGGNGGYEDDWGSGTVNGKGKTLTIICYEAGFGTAWLEELAREFESAYGCKVTVKKSYINGELIALLNDNSINDDIVMALGTMDNAQDRGFLVDLSPVYNSIPQGETQAIKDKMTQAVYEKLLTDDGKIYQMNWANSVSSIVLNKSVLDRIFPDGYDIPNTTDELIAFADAIKAKGVYPFSVSTSISYWDYAHYTWWAQYDGYDKYIDYYHGYYHVENADGTVTRVPATNGEVLDNQGRVESLKVAETLLKKDNGYMHKYADSMTWQESQIAFVGQGYAGSDMTECAMMVNGDWLQNEVQSYLINKNQELVMIKMPIISSIVDTLENKNMTDAQLSAVIDAIDAGATSYEGVSEKDFNRLSEARRMVYSATFDHCLGIPAKAKNKALAMEFLKFMASDMGQAIYAKHLNGLSMAYGYQPTGELNSFVASRYEITNNMIPICLDFSSPLVYRQGHTAYTTGSGVGLDGFLYSGRSASWIIQDTKTTLLATWDEIFKAFKEE